MLCALSVPLCQKFQQQGVVPQGVLCQLLAVLSALHCGRATAWWITGSSRTMNSLWAARTMAA